MSAFIEALRREWRGAEEQDREHVRWGLFCLSVFSMTAVAALIMQAVLP